MIASIATPNTSLLPDMAPVPVAAEASTPQRPQITQPGTTTTTPATSSSSQDKVELSSTALDMSKTLNALADKNSEIKKQEVKKQEQAATQEPTSYSAPGKSYPPFMGNGSELKNLKESSPSLYREILRMIVPPPVDLSYADMQALRNVTSGSNSSSNSKLTTA